MENDRSEDRIAKDNDHVLSVKYQHWSRVDRSGSDCNKNDEISIYERKPGPRRDNDDSHDIVAIIGSQLSMSNQACSVGQLN